MSEDQTSMPERDDRKAALNERAQHLLKGLIERYIREGEPVGSRTLARDTGLDLSPATVRNVMADLEELGFVRSPHTSAGRVPTVQGYRFFVDTLLKLQPLTQAEVRELQREFASKTEIHALMESASSMLSGITRLAGVVTLPRREQTRIQHIEFLSLSDDRVLAILVHNEREVQNCIIRTGKRYRPGDLQSAANYLNAQFSGRNLREVRRRLLEEMQETRRNMDQMMRAAIEMAAQLFGESEDGEDFVLAGQTNLMDFHELCDVGTLRQLFEAFNQKREILNLLDQCLSTDGVQIFIGEESGYQVLDECSVVTAPYSVDGRVVGVLGVIGPTRMAYDRVIPIVDIAAKLLGAALKPQH